MGLFDILFCPECKTDQPVEISGNMAGHRKGDDYCKGSGMTKGQAAKAGK